MLRSLQNKYERKIDAEFNLYSLGLNQKARLMLEEIRSDVTKAVEALQMANDEMIKFMYGPKKDDMVQLRNGLISRCEQVENTCMNVLARISANMLNAIAHPLFEPMALDATAAMSDITMAISTHEGSNDSDDLQKLFEAGAGAVKFMLDDNYSSIQWQLKMSENFIQAFCKRFATDDMHSDMRDMCRTSSSISYRELHTQRGVFANFNVRSIKGLTRKNLVDHIFAIFKGGFQGLNEHGKYIFSDRQRLIYYLIN